MVNIFSIPDEFSHLFTVIYSGDAIECPHCSETTKFLLQTPWGVRCDLCFEDYPDMFDDKIGEEL